MFTIARLAENGHHPRGSLVVLYAVEKRINRKTLKKYLMGPIQNSSQLKTSTLRAR